MSIEPVVRYMLLCKDWLQAPENDRFISIFRLIGNLTSIDDPPYPLRYEEICVVVVLTEGYGTGTCDVVCVYDEDDRKVFATHSRRIQFGADPLEIVGVPLAIVHSLSQGSTEYNSDMRAGFWR